MKIVSGIRPSGELTIANYIGAIKQFIRLQENNECYFFIADLHGITTPYEPKKFSQSVLSAYAIYLALGLDNKKAKIFLQSKIPEHSELAWLLETITPMGELERMTQYKEKRQEGAPANAGLLLYPVLMAADILLYKVEAVPVGEDQVQHVELTRFIADKFNKKFGRTFPLPKALVLGKNSARIKSLQNPNKKMSKSDADPDGSILLLDPAKEITRKIKKAMTDSDKDIRFDPIKKPAIANLLTVFAEFSGENIKALEKKFSQSSYAEFKTKLAELLVQKLEPVQKKYFELIKNTNQLTSQLSQDSEGVRKTAAATLAEVKEKMGFRI
ncbi:MAG: tryptophan--tRNA ligase [Patescibacteria group bacterium]